MITLGIDPGLATIGFGVLESRGGTMPFGSGRLSHLRHGVIRTAAGEKLEDRLRVIYEDVTELIRTFRPGHMAVEELFFDRNVTTGIPVAHARGVILLAASNAKLPVFPYNPMQIKLSVVGYGKAEKRQVMEMTRQILGLEKVPKPDDAADALAVALCHCNMHRMGL